MKPKIKLIKPSAFKRLKVMGKRMAIARDVLYRIKLGLLEPTKEQSFFESYNIDYTKKVGKKVVNENSCEVCAKGAVLCSFIGNFNKYDIRKYRFDEVKLYPKEILQIWRA